MAIVAPLAQPDTLVQLATHRSEVLLQLKRAAPCCVPELACQEPPSTGDTAMAFEQIHRDGTEAGRESDVGPPSLWCVDG